MDANGGWEGPTALYPTLAGIKLSMVLGEPEDAVRQQQFATACENIATLLDSLPSEQGEMTGVLLAELLLQIRHCLFAVRNNTYY